MKKGRSEAVRRVLHRTQAWWKEDVEVSYPKQFWVQLGACAAVFLVLFGLKNVENEPVQAVLGGIRSVATTEMEWDDTIGKLEYVGNFVPESVMVFWNAEEKKLDAPLENATLLIQSGDWAVFEGEGNVLCGAQGHVESIAGETVTVRCDSGLRFTVQPVSQIRVKEEERVYAGQALGKSVAAKDTSQVRVKVMDGATPLEARAWLR